MSFPRTIPRRNRWTVFNRQYSVDNRTKEQAAAEVSGQPQKCVGHRGGHSIEGSARPDPQQ